MKIFSYNFKKINWASIYTETSNYDEREINEGLFEMAWFIRTNIELSINTLNNILDNITDEI